MKFPFSRLALTALSLVAAFLGGCASARQTVYLPYNPPTGTKPNASAPLAAIASVTDNRPDRMMNMFLKTDFDSFVQESFAAELLAAGVFRQVTAADKKPENDYAVSVTVQDVSWAVPNHSGMVNTAFWTSFLTGGLGGLAYGSTSTPVYGRAEIYLRIVHRETGRVVLAQSFESLDEEHLAKLKCDTLETRARVMAEAWKIAVGKAVAGARAAVQPAPKTE